jgi:hypothetical protein
VSPLSHAQKPDKHTVSAEPLSTRDKKKALTPKKKATAKPKTAQDKKVNGPSLRAALEAASARGAGELLARLRAMTVSALKACLGKGESKSGTKANFIDRLFRVPRLPLFMFHCAFVTSPFG